MRLIEQALRTQGIATETVTTDDDGEGGRTGRSGGTVVIEEGAARRYFRKNINGYKVSMSLAWWLFKHARQYDIVHIHALFSFSSTVAAWSARRAGVPYVIRPLGTLAIYGMSRRRPWLKRLSLALIEAPNLRRAAAVHFTSEMEREEAGSLGIPMRAAIIPLAVEPAPAADLETLFKRFPDLRGKRWVLYLSRLDPKKNVEGLLGAIALCSAQAADWRWLIAGDGEPGYVDQLHGLARSLGIDAQVVWAGHIDGAQKSAALAHAEFFVLPSLSENFGIAAAEAMQAGIPVILGKGVALSALASENGAGVSVEPEPESIASALNLYLLDPVARARAGANAKSLATREFSTDSMGLRLTNLYDTILAAPDKAWPCDVDND